MKITRTTSARVAAVGATTVLLGAMSAAPSVAAGHGDVAVANTETVQVYTSATGEPGEQRIYEQLAFTGDGTVTVRNPVSTEGLRNLDGFGGFDVQGDRQVAEVDVHGERRMRTVSDYTGELPVDVSVRYFLDGEEVQPGDVVGESGVLQVRYRVVNKTGQLRTVTYDDGTGRQVSERSMVLIPMVGQLTTTLPSTFTGVRSGEANVAGDGRGGTKLSFTLTLLPPIGSATAEFGYEARIVDGVVPAANVSVLPVNPLQSPSFKRGAESYAGGADTGAQLVGGADLIDENLLKLRDGAGELLAGLVKLRAGASELNAGLAERAAPGSQRLAAGAETLADGLSVLDDGGLLLATKMGEAHDGSADLAVGAGRLADGLGDARSGGRKLKDGADDAADGGEELASGLGDLSAGAGDLRDGLARLETGSRDLASGFNDPSGQTDLVSGSRDLVTGLQQIRDGVNKLAASDGIPKAAAGAKALEAGIDTILAKIGTTDDPTTFLGGLTALESGLSGEALPGAEQIDAGVGALLSTDENAPGLPVAKAGVDEAKAEVDQMKAGVDGVIAAADPSGVLALSQGVEAAQASDGCASDPVCTGTLSQVLAGIGTLQGELQASADSLNGLSSGLGEVSVGLGKVSVGLGGAIGKIQGEMKPGTEALVAGLTEAVSGAGQLSAGAGDLQAALNGQIKPGLHALVAGLDTAVAGLSQLAPGTDAAAAGASDLAGGIFKAGEGADQIADGLGTAGDGSRELAAGARRAKAGGEKLSGGLGLLDGGMFDLFEGLGLLKSGSGDLADGSGRLEDGLSRLADGAAKLSDGATKAADGSVELSEGADELADGLGDAADGSGRLADGLGTAADGAPRLVDGAQRLSDEGMGKLIDEGKETAIDYGRKYAVIEASAARAQQEGMAYGAPAGADGSTAFTYELAAVDGEGNRNLTRGLGALALLVAGVVVAGFRRRFA